MRSEIRPYDSCAKGLLNSDAVHCITACIAFRLFCTAPELLAGQIARSTATVERLLLLPRAVREWWRERARPKLEGVAGAAAAADAWVSERARGWTQSSRVRSVAPGSTSLPIMAAIEEEEEGD